jgi:hypothetical protein
VDHDHATGKIRSLLCAACNVALAHIEADSRRLLGIAEYLVRWQLPPPVE